WIRLYGRGVVPKSELRWQALASSMDLAEVRDLVGDIEKGCRFITTAEFKSVIHPASAAIDVALGMAKASEDGLAPVGQILLRSGRDLDDAYLWAAISFLAERLPDSDPDAIAWTRLLRNRGTFTSATVAAFAAGAAKDKRKHAEEAQMRLFS